MLRHMYAPEWVTTGVRGVLAATMTDAYAAADAILVDHFGDGSGSELVPVQYGAHTEDVDLEGLLREGRRTHREGQPCIARWQVEGRCWGDTAAVKKRTSSVMGWEEAHEFLTSTGALSVVYARVEVRSLGESGTRGRRNTDAFCGLDRRMGS